MKKIVSLAALSAGATLAAPLAAAEPCYLQLKAGGQNIDGEATGKGREKTIECIAFETDVTAPRDLASGMATGKRQWGAIKCTKRVDKSSALLLKALVTNQVVDATFKFYRANPVGGGGEEQFYTVAIKNARIGSIKQVSPNSAQSETRPHPFQEEVSFVVQSIEVTSGPNVMTDNTAVTR
jgi:type VI secretion system secreted protein Hcp